MEIKRILVGMRYEKHFGNGGHNVNVVVFDEDLMVHIVCSYVISDYELDLILSKILVCIDVSHSSN